MVTDPHLLGLGSHEKLLVLCSKYVCLMNVIFRKKSNINKDWLEWVRHESPRADIRRGRSYKLSDASGRLPDAI